MSQKQRTISRPVTVSGVGLHTGVPANLTFHPAPANHWFKFRRTDLEGKPTIDVDANCVVDTSRGTTLEQNGARVSTTEHALAALIGMELDNVLIEIDGPEVPILDGSSKPFLEAIQSAGVEEQDAIREIYVLEEVLSHEEPERNVEMLAVPSPNYRITVMVDYNSPVLGTQHAQLHHVSEFEKDFAPCRTFCFLHELEMLVKHNLVKGGDLNNAIVVVDREVPQENASQRERYIKQYSATFPERTCPAQTVGHHW